METLKYIPADFDIGKIKEALITGDKAQRDYALKLIEAWPRPGEDHGFSDSAIDEMTGLGGTTIMNAILKISRRSTPHHHAGASHHMQMLRN